MKTLTHNEPVRRTNPQKFLLWIGIASLVMAFAGLTSAYLVKRAHTNWLEFSLPKVFWVSTLVILLSSFTMHLAVKAFKNKERGRYRMLISATALLGLLFCALQIAGFHDITTRGISILGNGSNPAASFLGVICGFHILHVLGGVVALAGFAIRSYNAKVKDYNPVPVEIMGTYWHFVDVLWIYLLIFFNIV